jgi:chromosome segregation ATPase
MMFEEEFAHLFCAVADPFRKLLVRYHEAIRRVRGNEQQCMKIVQNHHRELEEFTRQLKEQKYSQAEIDCQMDKHSAQLLEYDMQLESWFDHWAGQNVLMVQADHLLVEENHRRIRENARREEHDRQGHRRWFKEHSHWVQNHTRWAQVHNRCAQEYNIWVQTYDRFVQEQGRKLGEYKELFAKQAHFSRKIGNYQITRYFEEIERLNDAVGDSVEEAAGYATELNDSGMTLREGQGSVEGMEQMAAKARRQWRHTQ